MSVDLGTILRKPIITERSSAMREQNQYVIEVSPNASKGQIKSAVQDRFKVNVLAVRTIKIHGKFRRKAGPVGGYQPDRKKAIVRIKAGEQIKWEEVA